MSIETKYLVFKGLDKKEQILFKSFLNLARNELEYQVVILKEGKEHSEEPNIVILDAGYEFTAEEASLATLPTIKVGKDGVEAPGYIVRPVQWSDFKTQLTRLDIDGVNVEEEVERVLPQEMEFAIVDMDEPSENESSEDKDAEYEEVDQFEYELDNLSVDYHSFTNSEFEKAADEVKGFNVQDVDAIPQAVVLVTDDESGSANSVLVIETNSLDAWEMSEAEFEEPSVDVGDEPNDSSYIDAKAEEMLTERLKQGTEISAGETFWDDDGEIFSGREHLMFVKSAREMVYSYLEPGKWTSALRNKVITKLPLKASWRPTDELKVYPLSRLNWAHTIATKNNGLLAGLDAQTEYILEKWPDFELLELDNMLLKLCTMLFVNSESPHSLLQKSGYSRTVVYGFINACYELGVLHAASDFDLEQFSVLDNEEGMFGKIKDVFRN